MKALVYLTLSLIHDLLSDITYMSARCMNESVLSKNFVYVSNFQFKEKLRLDHL